MSIKELEALRIKKVLEHTAAGGTRVVHGLRVGKPVVDAIMVEIENVDNEIALKQGAERAQGAR